MTQVRHLKTIMQHVFVLDDGGTLVERIASPVEVSAEDFTHYPFVGFAQLLSRLQEQQDAEIVSAGQHDPARTPAPEA